MDTRRLQLFVVLADTLNFRAAAQRVHLSQPALSRAILALEEDLGVRLFQRDRRQVALSAEGAALLPQARRILASLDEFTYAARSMAVESEETLSVGIYGNGLAELTDVVLSEFSTRYPRVRLQIHEANFHRGVGPLLDGFFHVGFLRVPSPVPELRTVPVFQEPLDALVPTAHPLSAAESVEVHELFDYPWATFASNLPGTWAAHWLVQDHRGDRRPVIGTYARTALELMSAVAHQGQVALMPRSALRLRPHIGVRAIPVVDVPSSLSLAAVATPAFGARPMARALADLAAELAPTHRHLVPESQEPDAEN